MDCECSAPDGSDSGLKCTYPKCPFGEWEDKQQPDYKRPDDICGYHVHACVGLVICDWCLWSK